MKKNTWKRIVALFVIVVMVMSNAVCVWATETNDEAYDLSVELSQSSDTVNYSIFVDQTDEGVITVSADTAEEGQLVTIQIEPEDGKQLDRIVINEGTVDAVLNEDGVYSFDMPACDVTVSAEWSEAVLDEDGTYSSDDSDVAVGAEQSEAVLDEDGTYSSDIPDSDVAVDAERSDAELNEDGTYSSDMPDSDVTVGAEWSAEEQGTLTYTVGDGVTATIVTEANWKALYFNSDNGTLYDNWRSIIGLEKLRGIQSVGFMPESGTLYFPEKAEFIFYQFRDVLEIDLSKVDTSKATSMYHMFAGCNKLKKLDLSNFNTEKVTNMSYMFQACSSLTELNVSSFDTKNVTTMNHMFGACGTLTELDLSSFDMTNVTNSLFMLSGCDALEVIKTPKNNRDEIELPTVYYDAYGNSYEKIPVLSESITLTKAIGIGKASISGVSLSYGYSGKAYTPNFTVKVNGLTLTKGTDYTVKYANNIKPGTATITITGKGNYTGTRIKTFKIVDCVSALVSGKTYQLIPKNNSSTAVCSYSGRMVNNTKVYITNRSNSEAMKFKAVKNSDGTWKFINAKCELALAVQQNSSEVGKGLILYDQTANKAQNWKLTRKSDNSFAITNAASGLYVSMSDMSAPKGTLLSMKADSGRGDQRFYIAETSEVSAPFAGTYAVKASKNKAYGLNIASSSKADGANVNLYKYSNTNAKKFKVMYSGGGYYRLVNVNSGRCLTVKGNTKADGANVIQSKWQAQSGQKWKISKNANGTVTLRNALGTVLHLSGNKIANGTNIVAKKASSTTAQKWYLN